MHYPGIVSRIFLLLLLTLPAAAQEQLTQTIRGRVIDADGRSALAEAQVSIPGTTLSVMADSQGYFKLQDVPVGRQTLKISTIGYDDKIMPNLLLVRGKETVLEIEMREAFRKLDAVVVSTRPDKSRVSNDMALLSARGFSVEETKRYAGSLNDPARMVSAYAGVNSDGSGNNDIIVRGNNSRNIQWRLEGVEIPNPNHFAQEGLTGGPINALNSQMLANSDFYTGAFAPQYGNALAGIFDMRLRTGNNEKREYSIAAGVLGTDITLEGPFVKNKKASYLVNYRYSTLGILDQLGVVDFDGVPRYQDASFKFFIPTERAGTFSVFGLWGKSGLDRKEYDDILKDQLLEKADIESHLGIAGVSHYLPLKENIYLRNTVSYSGNGSKYRSDRPVDSASFKEYERLSLGNRTLRVSSTLNVKLNARNNVQAGMVWSRYNYDMSSRYFDVPAQEYLAGLGSKGDATLLQGFVSWRWRLTERLTLVNGLHSQKTSLNSAISVEPRSALRLDIGHGQALTAGFGLHSKMDALPNYFAIITDNSGNSTQPNTRLAFSKAAHYVIGYENKLGKNLFAKVEAYYQALYNIPIDGNPLSTYSLLNQDDIYTDHALVNKGKGRNLGLELTLERYFSNNYYFLVTASVFDSRYVAGDGVWRNTRYNGNFTSNALFGKEFALRNRNGRNRVIGVNTKVSYLGGRRLLPIDLAASQAAGKAVYIESKAFEKKNDDVFSVNLGIVYRVDRKRTSHEIKLDVQNITGNAANTDYYYSSLTGQIKSIKQLTTLPVLSYTINF